MAHKVRCWKRNLGMLIHLPPACLASDHAKEDQESHRLLSSGSRSLKNPELISTLILDRTAYIILTNWLPMLPGCDDLLSGVISALRFDQTVVIFLRSFDEFRKTGEELDPEKHRSEEEKRESVQRCCLFLFLFPN